MPSTFTYLQTGTFELPPLEGHLPDGWVEVPYGTSRAEAGRLAAAVLGTRTVFPPERARRLARWMLAAPRDLWRVSGQLCSSAPPDAGEVLASLLIRFGAPMPGEMEAAGDTDRRAEIHRRSWDGVTPTPELSTITTRSGTALRALQHSRTPSGEPRTALSYAVLTTSPTADITVTALLDGAGDHSPFVSGVDTIVQSLGHPPAETPPWES